MTRYFAQNTPRAGLEHMMMSVPGFQKRGGGMMILSRFCYKPEDVDCRYCLHYRRRSCQVHTCPYIAERLKSGAIEYLDLILEYFGHIPHAGLHKRIQAVEHWSGPDQAVLHTVSVHLRSRFADRVFHDVEQLPERGHRNSIGDASDVGAALSKLQAHPMLRNALLFPQLCDAVPHKRFIAAVIVHDPLPPISTYYFNIRERRGFALKSSTFASHNE